MKKNNVLINAGNLHSGGGLQVAISFISEISALSSYDTKNYHVLVSSEVNEALVLQSVDVKVFGSYTIFNTYGIFALFSDVNKLIKNYDLVFTVFGPNYLRVRAKKEIVGFAQPWILNFKNPISKGMTYVRRNILRAKFSLQWIMFLRSDHYVVELEHVKNALIKQKNIHPQNIDVAYNTVSSLYLNKTQWSSVSINKDDEEVSLGIIARDYPHKNINIYPLVAEILEVEYKLKVHFYTTFNDAEWAKKNDVFKKYVSTVGSLTPDQCPSFYEQIDGVVFPSLLECFSASPLETLVMKKPLFASDRGFVKDVCGEYGNYFDPLDANDIASKIAKYYQSNSDDSEQLNNACNHALEFSSAKGRAKRYLQIIQQQLEG